MTTDRPRRARAPLLRAIRPHQWAKNALLFLPALAAHLPWTPELLTMLAAGFLAFSFGASALYLLNDVMDRESDRRHPTKGARPIASGTIGTGAALATAAVLAGLAAALAVLLPAEFRAVLLAYLVLSAGYSLLLKRKPVLDVITLATLYTARVVAGAALADVPLSRWFLAFSVFFFLSLALVKRAVELLERAANDATALPGRGYVREDLPVLVAFGAAASAADALVYCLYITGEEVGQLYVRPDLLWLGLPMLLYWQARVWMLTNRGDMHEDPVVFALRDRVSYLLLAGFLLTVLVAA